MLTGIAGAPERARGRHPFAGGRRGDGRVFGRVCVIGATALSSVTQALTAFCTSRASSSWPCELVGAADQVAGLALERVRRRLEVAGVDVDDVGDRVDQQADGLAVQPDDDDDGVGALGPRRAAEPLAQLDRGDDLAAQVDQAGDGGRRQRHAGELLAAQHLLHVLDLDAVQVAVQPEGGQLPAGGGQP